MKPVCSISVDLDPLGCYYGIHGLGDPPPALADVVLRRAVPRFASLLKRRGITATFFVVGSDLDGNGTRSSPGRAIASDLAKAGHELGNHSYSHPYELCRLSRERV